jgi:plastocyanin domain-containing protein
MSPADWAVAAAVVAAVFWVLWYFFRAGSAEMAAAAVAQAGDPGIASGVEEATIVVRGGYEPRVVRVHVGRPVRLVFDRQETSGCSEEVVFPDFSIRKFLPPFFLPPFQKTTIELTPPTAGTYEFTCGMSMLHGRLVAE